MKVWRRETYRKIQREKEKRGRERDTKQQERLDTAIITVRRRGGKRIEII